MLNLLAISDLLTMLEQSHYDMASMYGELAMHLDPSLTDYDALVLAQAIQGEGAGDFGANQDQLAVWIAHTAFNRWEKPYWKRIGDVDCTFAARVEYDWHGTKRIAPDMVESWARRIAYRELRERRRGGVDQANGALHAMSLKDLRKHGWEERAREIVVHVIVHPGDPLVQFWFLSDFPGPKEER